MNWSGRKFPASFLHTEKTRVCYLNEMEKGVKELRPPSGPEKAKGGRSEDLPPFASMPQARELAFQRTHWGLFTVTPRNTKPPKNRT